MPHNRAAMTLFPGAIYGGVAQLGASAKATGVTTLTASTCNVDADVTRAVS